MLLRMVIYYLNIKHTELPTPQILYPYFYNSNMYLQ